MKTHQEIDQRSLALHRLVASKIRANPDLFGRAKITLARWRDLVSNSSHPYLTEWETLMQQGMEPCLAMATEDSPRAAALRQSSPFAGILTHQERFAFLKNWSRSNEASST
ncbi:MAG: hypothetical protein JNM52_05970 [Betaproteobacteria bacterium]|nr:hypothetical protein [Betaproteobacteria bacterium]